MSGDSSYCGVGGWSGPLPGDPDNNSILSATPAYGGIDVSWSFPATNPHAVAHTLIYRSATNDFNTAIQRSVAAGNFYYDRIEDDTSTLFYYWIKIVSVNGTVGEAIGPASATAFGLIANVIAALTDQIDKGLLAQSLKTSIDNIVLNADGLTAEIANRVAGNAALSAGLTDVANGVTSSIALINTEITNRTSGMSALLTQVDTIAAVNATNAAAVNTETTARVAADSALAHQMVVVAAASVEAGASVLTETIARTTAHTALASKIDTVEAVIGDDFAAVQVAMTAEIDNTKNIVDAMYTAKVEVNGVIGGFGLHSDGTTVDAGFDVDRFWVGRTSDTNPHNPGGTGVKPFIIDNGVVYINDAAINKLTFTKLRDESGAVVIENGQIKANFINGDDLRISSGAFNQSGYAWPASGTAKGFYLGAEGLLLGNSNSSPQQYFQVSDAGQVSAPGFRLEDGWLKMGVGAVDEPSFSVSPAGVITADLVNVKRREVIQTGTLTSTETIAGVYDSFDYNTPNSEPIITQEDHIVGSVFAGTVKSPVLTGYTDADIQNVTKNQPYYVAAYFTGSMSGYIGGPSTIHLSVSGRPTVIKTYSNESNYVNNDEVVVIFDYVVKLVSGSFTSFTLPPITWTLFKI